MTKRRTYTAEEWAAAAGQYRSTGVALLAMGVLGVALGTVLWIQGAQTFLSGPMTILVGVVTIGLGGSFLRTARRAEQS